MDTTDQQEPSTTANDNTTHKKRSKRVYTVFAFFGGIIAVLALQSGMSQLRGQTVEIGAVCKADRNCRGTTTICENNICTLLEKAVCTCSQPQVLQCADVDSKARHTFCENGCKITLDGAECA